MHILNVFSYTIFLHNSETWTLTKKLENDINIFQRNLLRKIINTKWPRKITNENIYKITNLIPWDIKIRNRRLRWLGHLMRQHPETPVRKSLSEFIKPDNKQKGRPKTNWIQIICNDLKENDFKI